MIRLEQNTTLLRISVSQVVVCVFSTSIWAYINWCGRTAIYQITSTSFNPTASLISYSSFSKNSNSLKSAFLFFKMPSTVLKKLGKNGPEIPPIGFGAMGIGIDCYGATG